MAANVLGKKKHFLMRGIHTDDEMLKEYLRVILKVKQYRYFKI
jgi:hypothetical protein